MSFDSQTILQNIEAESIWIIKILIIVAIFIFFHFSIKFFLQKLAKKAQRLKKQWQAAFFQSARQPALVILWLLCFSYISFILIKRFDETEFLPITYQLRSFLIIVCLAWFALKWTKNTHLMLIKSEKKPMPDKVKIDILSKLVTLFIIFIATIFGLEALGFNVQTLATIGGISGFSLGFAGKDVISNFFGGLMLYITRPFVAGETIKSPDRKIEGTVEEISWYYTLIRGPDKQPIYVPNAIFSNILVTNLTRMSHWNIDERIGIRYKDMHLIEKIINEIENLIKNDPAIDISQPIRVYLDKFANFSVEIVVWACTFATDKDTVIRIRQEIFLKIAKVISSHGADFSFPTTTIEIPEPIIVHSQK